MTAIQMVLLLIAAAYVALGFLLFIMTAVAMAQRGRGLDLLEMLINLPRLTFFWPFWVRLVPSSDRPTPGCNCPSCHLKRERLAREREA